ELLATLSENAQSYQKYVASHTSDYLSIAVARKRIDGWLPFTPTPTALLVYAANRKKNQGK
ncbi:hypothetical protein, partial [Salmonella sp. s58408]|uniref:hypothetical protein n=1 Tax=Salmonella sp. s58408 TaxID=3159701 RepID=UPI00397E95DE